MKDDRRKLDFGSGRPLVEESEIFSDLGYAKGSSLFLGRYTLNEVIAVLKKRGFLREAEKRGLGPLVFDLDSFEAPLQRFRIFHRDKSTSRSGSSNSSPGPRWKTCRGSAAWRSSG
jgi:hypothetical protein